MHAAMTRATESDDHVGLVVVRVMVDGVRMATARAGPFGPDESVLLAQGAMADAHLVSGLDGHLGVGRSMRAHVRGVAGRAIALTGTARVGALRTLMFHVSDCGTAGP